MEAVKRKNLNNICNHFKKKKLRNLKNKSHAIPKKTNTYNVAMKPCVVLLKNIYPDLFNPRTVEKKNLCETFKLADVDQHEKTDTCNLETKPCMVLLKNIDPDLFTTRIVEKRNSSETYKLTDVDHLAAVRILPCSVRIQRLDEATITRHTNVIKKKNKSASNIFQKGHCQINQMKSDSLYEKKKPVPQKQIYISQKNKTRRKSSDASELYISVGIRTKSDPKPCKKSWKHKVSAFTALKVDDEDYEDDLYEHKNFDIFKELFVETSFSPVPSDMPTPVSGLPVTPRITERSAVVRAFHDFISHEDFANFLKVSVDNKRRIFDTDDFMETPLLSILS